MIEFKPHIKDDLICYTSYENSIATGSIKLVFSETKSEITFLEASDSETAEGLIRSALNAAGNRNVYSCTYGLLYFSDVFLRLGFTCEGGKLYGEIPFIFQKCCGCGNSTEAE